MQNTLEAKNQLSMSGPSFKVSSPTGLAEIESDAIGLYQNNSVLMGQALFGARAPRK